MAEPKNKYTYSFGDESPNICIRLLDFLVQESMLADVVIQLLTDEKNCMKIRRFIFNDDELLHIWLEWIRTEKGWPVTASETENDINFWKLRFGKFFTMSQQSEILREMFSSKIINLLSGDADD